jgi:hypothetical protein
MIAGFLECDAPQIDERLHGRMVARELFEGALMVDVGPAIACRSQTRAQTTAAPIP